MLCKPTPVFTVNPRTDKIPVYSLQKQNTWAAETSKLAPAVWPVSTADRRQTRGEVMNFQVWHTYFFNSWYILQVGREWICDCLHVSVENWLLITTLTLLTRSVFFLTWVTEDDCPCLSVSSWLLFSLCCISLKVETHPIINLFPHIYLVSLWLCSHQVLDFCILCIIMAAHFVVIVTIEASGRMSKERRTMNGVLGTATGHFFTLRFLISFCKIIFVLRALSGI